MATSLFTPLVLLMLSAIYIVGSQIDRSRGFFLMPTGDSSWLSPSGLYAFGLYHGHLYFWELARMKSPLLLLSSHLNKCSVHHVGVSPFCLLVVLVVYVAFCLWYALSRAVKSLLNLLEKEMLLIYKKATTHCWFLM